MIASKRPSPTSHPSSPAEKRRRLSTPTTDEPSEAALLYHTACSAHSVSSTFLQQAFIPRHVSTAPSDQYDTLLGSDDRPFQPDPQAADKALALQVFALDCLRVGLKSRLLSVTEKAAFTVEFANVGLKVLRSKSGSQLEGRDRLRRDVAVAVTDMLATPVSPQMMPWIRYLEWVNVKLALVDGRINAAKRLVQQYSRDDASYFSLSFLLLEYTAPNGQSALLEDMMTRSRASAYQHIHQVLALVRLRNHFVLRRWDLVPSALSDFGETIGWNENAFSTAGPTSGVALSRHVYYVQHYILLRSLWEGRVGNDHIARLLFKKLYDQLDASVDDQSTSMFKQDGGIIPIGELGLFVQSTPVNIVFLLSFLATLTARRDYIGRDDGCRSLKYARCLLEWYDKAKMNDMWDTGFHPTLQGLAEVERFRAEIFSIQAEGRLEQAFIYMMRSSFAEAEQSLSQATALIQRHDLISLRPHLCIVHGQLAQLVGYPLFATRYYQAALALMIPGNELGWMVQATLWGVQGQFEGRPHDHALTQQMVVLGEKCARSNSYLLQIVGGIVLAILDTNRTKAKKRISETYDVCQNASESIYRTIIFALTSTTLLTGSEDMVLKQMETGYEISTLLGGKDRADGVGQTVLGLWFAHRMRSAYNRRQDIPRLNIARSLVQRHYVRLTELMEYGQKKYGTGQGELLGQLQGSAQRVSTQS